MFHIILEAAFIDRILGLISPISVGSPIFYFALVIVTVRHDESSIPMRDTIEKAPFKNPPVGVKVLPIAMRHSILGKKIDTFH